MKHEILNNEIFNGLLKELEDQWEEVIIKRYCQGRQMNPVEKQLFIMGFGTGVWKYEQFLKKRASQEEAPMPPIDIRKLN